MKIIEARGIHKSFGETKVLEEISLSVEEGARACTNKKTGLIRGN